MAAGLGLPLPLRIGAEPRVVQAGLGFPFMLRLGADEVVPPPVQPAAPGGMPVGSRVRLVSKAVVRALLRHLEQLTLPKATKSKVEEAVREIATAMVTPEFDEEEFFRDAQRLRDILELAIRLTEERAEEKQAAKRETLERTNADEEAKAAALRAAEKARQEEQEYREAVAAAEQMVFELDAAITTVRREVEISLFKAQKELRRKEAMRRVLEMAKAYYRL